MKRGRDDQPRRAPPEREMFAFAISPALLRAVVDKWKAQQDFFPLDVSESGVVAKATNSTSTMYFSFVLSRDSCLEYRSDGDCAMVVSSATLASVLKACRGATLVVRGLDRGDGDRTLELSSGGVVTQIREMIVEERQELPVEGMPPADMEIRGKSKGVISKFVRTFIGMGYDFVKVVADEGGRQVVFSSTGDTADTEASPEGDDLEVVVRSPMSAFFGTDLLAGALTFDVFGRGDDSVRFSANLPARFRWRLDASSYFDAYLAPRIGDD